MTMLLSFWLYLVKHFHVSLLFILFVHCPGASLFIHLKSTNTYIMNSCHLYAKGKLIMNCRTVMWHGNQILLKLVEFMELLSASFFTFSLKLLYISYYRLFVMGKKSKLENLNQNRSIIETTVISNFWTPMYVINKIYFYKFFAQIQSVQSLNFFWVFQAVSPCKSWVSKHLHCYILIYFFHDFLWTSHNTFNVF